MLETGETRCPKLKAKNPENFLRVFIEKLAATYSRRTYRTTTIGKTVFDGRVRNGIGSDHSFMATKNVTGVEWQVTGKPSNAVRARNC